MIDILQGFFLQYDGTKFARHSGFDGIGFCIPEHAFAFCNEISKMRFNIAVRNFRRQPRLAITCCTIQCRDGEPWGFGEVVVFRQDRATAAGELIAIARAASFGNAVRIRANSFHNWVIPKNAGNKTGAWEFIKMAVDGKGATDLATKVGALPTNKVASSQLKNPLSKAFLQLAANPQVPLLDSVVPLKVALLYYQQLQAAFSGKATPLKAMQNVDKGLASLNP